MNRRDGKPARTGPLTAEDYRLSPRNYRLGMPGCDGRCEICRCELTDPVTGAVANMARDVICRVCNHGVNACEATPQGLCRFCEGERVRRAEGGWWGKVTTTAKE